MSSPLATARIPGAPAAPLPFLLAGAGAAPATPTPLCCPGPGGPSAVWHAPWRGRTRSVWTPPRRGGGTPCPASGAPYTPGGPAAWRGSAGLPPTAPAQSVPTAGDALGPPVAPPSGRATLRGAGGLAPTRAIEPSRPTGGAPSRAVSRTGGTLYPALLQCTASLPLGSRQCNSCNALPHCPWAVGSATPAMHCPTGWGQCAAQLLQCTASLPWGQWAVELLQCTAPLPLGSRQCNSCNALPHCPGAVGSATPGMHCLTALGAVGSAAPVMLCLTGWGQCAAQLLQCTASLPRGSGQWTSCNSLPHCPGGSGQCSSCNALPHCPRAVGSATPAMHCLTAWGQWAVELLQCSAPLPGGSGQRNSCNALPHCLGAVDTVTPAEHRLTAREQ